MRSLYKIFLIIILSSSGLFAQQDAQYTQYMYNTMSVNPAYAGTRDAISITGLYRNQWVGFGGAPVTQTLNVHSPIGQAERVGLGFSIVSDKIGPSSETYLDIDFSYKLNVNQKDQLALGLKLGGHLLDVNFDQLNQYTNTDVLLDASVDRKFSPNVGVGAYYYSDKYYIGLSAPNLLQTKHFDESSDGNTASSFLASERINYYLIGGYVFDLSYNTQLKPAVLLKAVSGAPLQLDLSANLRFKERFIVGLAYRWSAALSVLTGFQVSDNLMLGFAYDWETTELGNTQYNAGSYEVILRYEIFKNKKVEYPRFF